MPERLTFDSEPILSFFLGETGGEIVCDYLTKIQQKEIEGFISMINMAEIYCILYRLDPSQADETCRALSHIDLTILPIEDDDLWRTAAKIKAQHSLSLADAFAVAAAERKKSALVIGSEKEFDGLTVRFLKQENNPTKIETNLSPQDQTNMLENLAYNRIDNSNVY